MGLKPGDSVSTWISCNEAPESYILHLACYKAGIKLLSLSSQNDLEKALTSTLALIFSPWVEENSIPRVDYVLDKVPSLLLTPTGSLVESSYATKYFIQSSFKTIRGTYKLKSIPVYTDFSTPVNVFEYTYNGNTVDNHNFQKFSEEFLAIVGLDDVVVNAVPCKHTFAFASIAAGVSAGAKSVSAVLSDPGEVCIDQKAKVLVITEEYIHKIGEKFNIEKLVIGVESKEDIERLTKLLGKKGVQYSHLFPYSLGNLSFLG